MSILKQLDSEVVNLVKEKEIAEEIERADAYMEDIYDAMAKLEQLLQRNSTADPSAAMAVRRELATSESKVNLPNLTIQLFKRELTTWSTLWDSYQVAIHINRSLVLKSLSISTHYFKAPPLMPLLDLPSPMPIIQKRLKC